MSKTSKVFLVLLIAAIIVLGVILLSRNDDDTTPPAQMNGGQTEQQQNEQAIQQQEEIAATITYTDTGFDQASITVPAGSTVEVVNQSQETLEFASDPHPTHTDNLELNIGTIAPGATATFMVTETGTWGYHNHLNETHAGQITIE